MTDANPTPSSEGLFDDRGVSILLIGDAGTHKTYFASTCPAPFFLDFDANLALARPRIEKGEAGAARFKEVAPNMAKIANPKRGIYRQGEAWPAFVKQLDLIGEALDKDNWPYRTIVLDSLTTFAEAVLQYVLKQARASNRYKDGDSIDPGLWGNQMRFIESIMNQLTGWPMNLVVLAHIERSINTGTTQTVEYLPMVTGKTAGRIGVFFNEVWYTEVVGTGTTRQFKLITESNGLYKQAKTTHGVPINTPADWEKVKQYFPEAYV